MTSSEPRISTTRSARLWRWCRRYISPTLLGIVAVIVAVLFLNDNSVMRTYEYQQEIDRLRAQIRDSEDSMKYYHELNRRLETDRETMEKIVRENYHMQRPGEDVYLFE